MQTPMPPRNALSPASDSGNSSKESRGYIPLESTVAPATQSAITLQREGSILLGQSRFPPLCEGSHRSQTDSGVDEGQNYHSPREIPPTLQDIPKNLRISSSSLLKRQKLSNNRMKPRDGSVSEHDGAQVTREYTRVANGSLSQQIRRKASSSNLTDCSSTKDVPNSKASKSTLHRIQSDNNMLSQKNSTKPQQARPINTAGPKRAMPRVRSQPTITDNFPQVPRNAARRASRHLSQPMTAGASRDNGQVGEESGEETQDRIRQWILGVEDAEEPPMPHIEDESPKQTDTAIHVVYTGD